MNLNASCGNHSMGLFRAFKSLLRRPSQRPLYVVGRLGRGEKARGGRWNSISSHRPPRACCFFITGLPVRPSHKFGFRSSVSKSGLPGREDTRVWYRETMFSQMVSYDFLAEPCTDTFCTSFLFLGAFDWEVWISDLQSNAKSENGFPRWEVCFWISFLPRIVWQILFRISQSIGKKEIHEIRIWIS